MPSLPTGLSSSSAAARRDGVRSSSSTTLTASSSSMDDTTPNPVPSPVNDPSFDILEWHPAHQSCQRYFLDHSQYEHATQAVCALINIRLPFQWLHHAIPGFATSPQALGAAAASPNPSGSGGSSSTTTAGAGTDGPSSRVNSPNASRNPTASNPSSSPRRAISGPTAFVSVIPYLRRLVVTGFDRPGILHGFFGDDWAKGVMPFVECERRNYLFAAKAGGWQSCKKQYDVGSGGGVGGDESVPFMKPLDGASAEELVAAETAWSHWLAMEDWMVGPRAPGGPASQHSQQQQSHQHQHQHQHRYHQVDGEPQVDGVMTDGVSGDEGRRRRRTRSDSDMGDCEVDGYG